MQAAALLADGAEGEPGIGSLLVVEVGGATTNIHSVVDQSPVTPQTVIRGLPESRVKRTVEGDLGIRYNAPTIYDFIGRDAFMAKLRDLYPSVDDDVGLRPRPRTSTTSPRTWATRPPPTSD